MTQTLARALFVLMCLGAHAALADEEQDREALRTEIEYLTETGNVSAGDIEIAAGNLIAEVYGRRSFSPAWNDLAQISDLIAAIKATEADGLNPLDYNLAAVESAYRDANAGLVASPQERAITELVLTDSLIRLGYHQVFGKVNPQNLDQNWNFRREFKNSDRATVVQEMIDSPSLSESLSALAPRTWFYRNLQTALADYRAIQARGGWPQIPQGPTLKPGTSDNRLDILARRLSITGDLEAVPVSPTRTYDDTLVEGVRRFQQRHGIDVDGVIGPATLRALNVPVEQRILQIKLSLERARWVAGDVEDDFVIVNIAAFRAYVIRDREIVWDTRVQVGTAYRKTPIFRDEMKYLVFNPTWTVPYSIATRDILPQIQRDPGYLAERNFDVKDRNGKLVDPSSVNWSELNRRNFGYTLVQRPGPANALGRLKFMFPNEHAVYLHDTPSRTLFGRAARAFSSGCIRVEHPFELAEILLGSDEWNQQTIQDVMDTRETKTVFLPKPLPVLLLYWTAQLGPDGRVNFYDDIYDRDAPIARALAEPFRLEAPGSQT
jgi:murein L,D-transpeptidase YcbB/YkuD